MRPRARAHTAHTYIHTSGTENVNVITCDQSRRMKGAKNIVWHCKVTSAENQTIFVISTG